MIATQLANSDLGLVNTIDHVDEELHDYELVGDEPRPFRGIPDDFIAIETDHEFFSECAGEWCL